MLFTCLQVGFISCNNSEKEKPNSRIQMDPIVNLPEDKNFHSNNSDTLPNPFSLWHIKNDLPVGHNQDTLLYGYNLLANTAKYLGPNAANPVLRISGSNMACQNCHLNMGAKPFGGSWIGVMDRYPVLRSKNGKINDIQLRVDGCFKNSMNGLSLPQDGKEMKAIVAYFKWLSSDTILNKRPEFKGYIKFSPPNRQADTAKGQTLYINNCASCHGSAGQGVYLSTDHSDGYVYPPLWGGDSYNLGAGMAQTLSLAGFIKSNMPYGTTYEKPALSDNDIYDIAAFVNTRPRPVPPGLAKNFPDLSKKKSDVPYPPYLDPFSDMQHRIGPFQPIDEYLKNMNKQKDEKEKTTPAKDSGKIK